MNSCININDPAFIALAEVFGEIDARVVTYRNNGVIPNVDKARAILTTQLIQEKDEQITRGSDEFKLEYIKRQQDLLSGIKANTHQQQVIDKLQSMLIEYERFLTANINMAKNGEENPVKSISVSSFIGNSDFKGDPKEYEQFKLFGTFVHAALEESQMISLQQNRPIAEIFTKEFFAKSLLKFTNKTPFKISNLSNDQIYSLTAQIIGYLQSKNISSYIIIPELTIIGKAVDGTPIIGRVDALLLDDAGNTTILDFKTKKIANFVTYDELGEPITNQDAVLDGLTTGYRFPIINVENSTAQPFQRTERNTYDTWQVQTDMYGNILAQNGIFNAKKSIVALFYQTTKEKKEFEGAFVHIYETTDFYKTGVDLSLDDDGFIVETASKGITHVKDLRRQVDKAMPYERPKIAIEKGKVYSFIPSIEQSTRFKAELEALVNSHLSQIYEQLAKLNEKPNEELKKVLEARRATLSTFKQIIENNDKADSLMRGHHFTLALQSIQTDLEVLQQISNERFEIFEKMDTGSNEARNEINKLHKIFLDTQVLQQAIKVAQELLNEMGIVPEAPQTLLVGNLQLMSQKIIANFKETAIKSIIYMFRSAGKDRFEKIDEQMKGVLKVQQLKIEDQLEKLKNGEGMKIIFSGLKNTLFTLMDKSYKARMEELAGPGGKGTLAKIEELEQKLILIETKQQGLKFNDDEIRKYVLAITDENEYNYIGTNDLWGKNGFLKNIFGNEWIASSSNSDPMIALVTLFIKRAKTDAEENIMHDTGLMKFEEFKNKMLNQGYTVEKINKALGEWRSTYYYNRETGAVDKRTEYFLRKPMSEEYESYYTQGKANMAIYNAKVSKARATYLQNPDDENLKSIYLATVAERENNNKEFVNWMLKNCNLPFRDEFYEIQRQLPEEIRDELQEILMEIETIAYPITSGSELILSDSDWERLDELEIQKRELREKAREQNPEYAKYLDVFDDLYEFDTNEGKFKANERHMLVQYAGDPEKQAEWYAQRMIVRPTKEWYTKLNELREIRAMFFEDDLVIKELIEQKSAILRKYRENSQINVTRITEDEIRAVEEIEGKIADHISLKEREELTEWDRERVREYTEEINRMSSPRLSKSYELMFDEETRILQSSKAAMDKARIDYENSPTPENEANLIAATTSFDNIEINFKEWYEKYHQNKYISIRKNASIIHGAQPRNFVYDRLPIASEWDMWMESVPNPKYYRLRRLRKENWYLMDDDKVMKHLSTQEYEEMPEERKRLLIENNLLIRREGAYNPNFIKSRDGIPLPKGLYKDDKDNLQIEIGYENSSNINQGFKDIRANKEMSDFYDATANIFFNIQKDMEGRSSEYRMPGFAASPIETLLASNYNLMTYAKKQFAIFEDKYLKINSEQDQTENLYGDINTPGTRMRFNRQLEKSMQSEDIIGSIFKYAVESHYTRATQEVAPYINSTIDYLSNIEENLQSKIIASPVATVTRGEKKIQRNIKSRKEELAKVIKMLKYERDKGLYGQLEEDSSRKTKKVIGGLFGYIAFIRLGFDITTQIKNYYSGSLQSFIGAGNTKSDFYSQTNLMRASAWVFKPNNGFLVNYMRDWGKIYGTTISTQIYRTMNPLQKDHMKYFANREGSAKRRLANKALDPLEASYLIQDKGDTIIGAKTMFAVMDRFKYKKLKDGQPELDAKGKEIMIPAHECYYLDENGMLQIRKDVAYTKTDQEFLRGIIYSETRRAQGNYAKTDQTYMESQVLGKMIFFFRKFLVPLFLNRFGYMRPNWEAGEVALGYWRALADCWQLMGSKTALKEFFVGSNLLKKFGTEGAGVKIFKKGDKEERIDIGDIYIRKIGQARRDAIAMIIVSVMSLLALAYIKRQKDEDDELSVLEGNAIRVLWGVKGETTAMFPIGSGSSDYIKNFTTAIPFVREGLAIQKTINHLFSYGVVMIANEADDKDNYYWHQVYQNAYYTQKSGAYDKGTPKIAKDMVDLTGIRNIRDLFQPENRLDVMQKNQ